MYVLILSSLDLYGNTYLSPTHYFIFFFWTQITSLTNLLYNNILGRPYGKKTKSMLWSPKYGCPWKYDNVEFYLFLDLS